MKNTLIRIACVVTCLTFSACGGGSSGSSGASNSNATLLAVGNVQTSTSPNCTNGAVTISVGLDKNNNGTLDSGETSYTQVVCTPAAGSASSALASVLDEPAGSNCPSGGKKFITGFDLDADGQLQVSEIASSNYICNGSSGSNSLMSIIPETAGVNCASGGVKIQSWLDTDGNGLLSSGENPQTVYSCNPASYQTKIISADIQSEENTFYIVSASAAVTLPTNPSIGSLIKVAGSGSSLWKIFQNANQQIILDGYTNKKWKASVSPSLRNNWSAVATSADGSIVVAVENEGNVYKSIDKGINWNQLSVGGWYGSQSAWNSVAMSSSGDVIAITESAGYLNISVDGGLSWTQKEPISQTSYPAWRGIAVSADGMRMYACALYAGIFISSDKGATWTQALDSSAQAYAPNCLAVATSSDGSKAYVAESNGYIYKTSNYGQNWEQTESSRSWTSISTSSDGVFVYASALNDYLYSSYDSASTWTTNDSLRAWQVVTTAGDGGLVLATDGLDLYESKDFGQNFVAQGQTAHVWNSLTLSSNGLYQFATSLDCDSNCQNWGYWSYPRTGTVFFKSPVMTTVGSTGKLIGTPVSTIELVYSGNGTFRTLNHAGGLLAQ